MASGHGRLPPPFGVPSPPCPFGATIEAAEWCQLRTGEGSSPRTAEMGLRASQKKKSSTFGPSLRASRGDPGRRLTAWVPPCSRSVQGGRARIAPRFPRPSPAEGPPRSRQCRSGPAGAAEASRIRAGRRVSSRGRGELGLDPAEPGLRAAGVPPPEWSAGGGNIALTADRSPMTEKTSWF